MILKTLNLIFFVTIIVIKSSPVSPIPIIFFENFEFLIISVFVIKNLSAS